MNELAIRLKAAREAIGETQEAFSERFGVDQSTLHRWETVGPSERGPARTFIEKMLLELECS